MSEELRKFAELLRSKAAALETEKTLKTAQLIQAAVGLNYLRSKLG